MGNTRMNKLFRITGAALLTAVMSFPAYGQGTTITQDPPSVQDNSTAQTNSFNTDAARFAILLAQQTGLSSDKTDKIREILIDYYNNITETRRDFLNGMRDPRSQDKGRTGMGQNNDDRRDVTGGQTGNINSNMPGGSSGSDQKGNSETGSSGSGTSGSGSSDRGTAGTGTNATGTTGSGTTDNNSGASGTNLSNIQQDLMSEYRKADEKADEKILDIFDNDSQKAQYVQVKRQWWDNVKERVFSSSNENTGGQQTR